MAGSLDESNYISDRGECVIRCTCLKNHINCPLKGDADLAREIEKIFGIEGDNKRPQPKSTANVSVRRSRTERSIKGNIIWYIIEFLSLKLGDNPASLKLLSAMAMCRTYSDSEEIRALGSSLIDWSRQHHNAPVAPKSEYWPHDYPRPRRGSGIINCQEHDKSDRNPDLSTFEALCDEFDEPYRCGWCRY